MDTTPATPNSSLTTALRTRIEVEICQNPVVLYMKGNGDAPLCGFSAQAVAILNHVGVPFHAVDILEDDKLRQGLKEYSQWPTFPQLYVKGELVGGADIMTDMFQTGELQDLLTPYKKAA